MHVFGFSPDLNWLLQFIVTASLIALGLFHLVKNTASEYFMVDANFESSEPTSPRGGPKMQGLVDTGDSCVVCGNSTTKQCSGCKLVRYCSSTCQMSHWRSHKTKCTGKVNSMQSASIQHGRRRSNAVSLVLDHKASYIVKQSKEILFPYEIFVELFNWDKPGFPPCGLLNCGNSCFANVVLQCLAYTRPLVAYLLEKGHRRECRRNDWCFLCEFQTHIERSSESRHPFSPINILSRLPNIGGNLGYGKQEDAHEFMRFAIDTMQSVCLDEFGGEKAIHPSTQETTLIQHIFGGHLQSQVTCAKCNNISNQYENMMDLTVEIQGDAASLEECLDQFTVREQLHGDNMYKCDGCNDYVMAWKRLTVRRAPNILTIALKRFQSGRFGKLNKRVTFPETLDLRSYMSEAGDGNDVYKLYAVVVHVDMLNASFFGHYICYTKDFCGNWYRIDDCKVSRVDLEEVLSQGAYMLLYSRVCARPSCLKSIDTLGEGQSTVKVMEGEERCAKESAECLATAVSINSNCTSDYLLSNSYSQAKGAACDKEETSLVTCSNDVSEDVEMVDSAPSLSVPLDMEVDGNWHSNVLEETASHVVHADRLVSGVLSCLKETFEPEACSLNSELISPNSGFEDKNRGERRSAKMSMDPTSEMILTMQNGACEGEMSTGAFVGGSSLDAFLDEIKSADSVGKPDKKVDTGKGLPSASGVKDTVGKLGGRNSPGAKLKPLFSPGFLGKHHCNQSMKRDQKSLSELGEIVSSCNSSEGISGVVKPCFPLQNGASTKDIAKPMNKDGKSLSEPGEIVASRNSSEGIIGYLKPDFLQNGKGTNDTGKPMRKDGKSLSELGEIVSSCNSSEGISRFVKPGFLLQKGAATKDMGASMEEDGKSLSELGEVVTSCNSREGISRFVKPGFLLQNGAGTKEMGTPMEEDGKSLSELGEIVSPCNSSEGFSRFVKPGFLQNGTDTKDMGTSMRKDGKSLSELGEIVSSCNSSEGTSRFAKPGFLLQKGAATKDMGTSMEEDGKSLSELGEVTSCNSREGISRFVKPGFLLQNGAGTKEMGTPMEEDGKSLSELGEIVSPCNSSEGFSRFVKPGFLQNGTDTKDMGTSMRKDGKSLSELGEIVSSCNSSEGTSRFAKPGFLLQKGAATKDMGTSMEEDGKSLSELGEVTSCNSREGISRFVKPGFPLQNGAGTKEMGTSMEEDGKSLSELGEIVSPCNSSEGFSRFVKPGFLLQNGAGTKDMGTPMRKDGKLLSEMGEIVTSCNSSEGISRFVKPGFLLQNGAGTKDMGTPVRKDGKPLSELGEIVTSCNSSERISQFVKRGFLLQNFSRTRDTEKANSVCNLSLPTTFQNQEGNCLEKATTLLSDSGEVTGFCNGKP